LVICSGNTPSGTRAWLSLRTEAVGQRRRARQAIIRSSAVCGWRANTDCPPRSTISPGAAVRAAPQSMQRVSTYQSPGSVLGMPFAHQSTA